MQETVTFTIPAEALQSEPYHGHLNGTVYSWLLHNLPALESLLTSYHFMRRERVFAVSVRENSVSMDADGNGSFVTDYHIGLFNACADVDHTTKTSMKIDLSADLITGEVRLTGEYIPEREPDEL